MENFWRAVDELKDQLDREWRIGQLNQRLKLGGHGNMNPPEGKAQDAEGRALLVKEIEKIILRIIQNISRGVAPKFTYRKRDTWNNISYEEGQGLRMLTNSSEASVRFDNIATAKRFALTFRVLGQIYRLLHTNSFCTKRDLYYQDPQGFGKQSTLDTIVDNISCMLNVPRSHLHVLATSKGLICGSLRYTDYDGSFIDCADSITIIPAHVDALENIQSDAHYVLLVEKDATYQRLIDENIHNLLGPCIILTGKGFPDINTRLMVRKLWDALHIPTLALVDADPHGMEILMVYKYGSRSLAFNPSGLNLPSIKWLGVWPSDIKRLNVPQAALIPLSQTDVNKGQELLKRPYIDSLPTWKSEIGSMLTSGVKAEIQCLDSISPKFLTDVYLPTKLCQGAWA